MDPNLLWAIVLLATALVLIFVEVFVPSGGLIGTVAAICLIASLVMFFWFDTVTGMVIAGVTALALPFVLIYAFNLWPYTPLAKYFMLDSRQTRLTAGEDAGPVAADELVGAEGKAITDLRPVGTCLIGGKRIECLATGGVIPAAARVKVVAVDGMNVKVTAIGNDE